MSVTIQGNTSTVISNNSAPEGTSEIAKITRQIQVLTEKLGKNLIGRGDDDTAEKRNGCIGTEAN